MEGESPEKEMDRGYKIGKDMTGLECLISEDVVKHVNQGENDYDPYDIEYHILNGDNWPNGIEGSAFDEGALERVVVELQRSDAKVEAL
ncbi:hypothetical protein V6N13_050347 [Hibiscus sabdariffa]